MVNIALHEGTITLNHEWPVDVRVDAYNRGEPIVSLEVDTDYGTAVVALNHGELFTLVAELDQFDTYYDTLQEDPWSSR